MALAIGIDLGTTNSCVAVVRDGKARVIQDRAGVALHPSVVSFHPDGRILVGTEAADRRVIDPQNTFYSVKRLIGRDFADPDVLRVAERYPYGLVEGPNRIPLAQARGREYTLPEISSIVLRHLAMVAGESTNEPLAGAVITVPANFNDVQRSSTRVAGRIAGLEVLRILNEPTAAALAYGYGQGLNERIAVYDFGGGTFDITILDLRENVFEVMATAGDMFLGGDDFDARLVDQMVASFLQLHLVDLRENPIALQRLRSVAEQIKCQLSARVQVSARIRELEYGPGGKPLDMNFSITRDAFEQRVSDLIERTFTVCDESFRLAQLSPSQLDNVILVGGTTRIPLIRRRVAEYFGREPRADINPDEVVAIGAAIQAFALTGHQAMVAASTVGPQEIGRPIGAAPDPEVMGLTDSPTAQHGELGSERNYRATKRGYPSRPASESQSWQTPTQDPHGLSDPATGSAAAAAFGGAVSDDLLMSGGERARRESGSAAAAAFGGALPDDLPMPRGGIAQPDSGSAAAAAFGGALPDDLPMPRGGQARRESGSAAAAAFGGALPDDLPMPRGGGGLNTPDSAPSAAMAAFGGFMPDDLPAPRGAEAAQDPYAQPQYQAPHTSQYTSASGQQTAPFSQVPDSPGLNDPGTGSAAAAAAFGGAVPDDLPSPKTTQRGPQKGQKGKPGVDDAFSSGEWSGSFESSFSSSTEWSSAQRSIGFSEESMIGSFTEDLKAPAAIGRPPPSRMSPAPGMSPIPQAFAPRPSPAPSDFGQDWNVLSMPGAPKPQVTPLPAEYVDSAVKVSTVHVSPPALGGVGALQAPGVAPLPSHLLQELGVSHVLIDVTPRTLAVQTVKGFCDTIIERNSPIPIEQTRVFTTSQDNQTAVVIRIAQGESRRVDENTILGEVNMTGIRPAPRGEVRIAVTFEIDTDGIVDVNARDIDTGQQAITKVTVFGGLSEEEVRDLIRKYGRQ